MASSSNNNSSYLSSKSRIRISDIAEAKRRGEKWAMLTSYDATSARVFDQAGIPCLLIGDSASQAVFGYKSTLPVTMDELIPLARAVANSCQRALVIADLPFGSYQESPQQALRNATRFMKESQAHGIKLEGGAELAEHVALLSRSGVPVMAHLGFTPQSEHSLSGYKIQGRGDAACTKICNDALALQQAGAFACVLEMVPNNVSREVTRRLHIPTVGIGAGPDCDGQILVWTDMAGFTAPKPASVGKPADGAEALELNRVPKFVKRYANLSDQLYKAALDYSADVESGKYPGPEHCYQ